MNCKTFICIVFSLLPLLCFSQETRTYRLHSHNDYLQQVPFWTALASNSSSIEVDVFLQEGDLLVAHELENTTSRRTLQSLYLDPIREAAKLGISKKLDFQLLVDLKTEAYPTLKKLEEILEEYRDVLAHGDMEAGVRVVVSGNRPRIQDFINYSDLIQFDYPDTDFTTELPWERIALVSLNFKDFSAWNGKGRLTGDDLNALEELIAKVHQVKKPIRFWGSPDGKTAWKTFHDLGIDYINTDHPFEANQYLNGLKSNVTSSENRHAIYKPTYETSSKVLIKNIILMIGDGNGLAHISAGMFAHGNDLNLAQLKHIGLVKTQSADDFTTDSAAGATAFATGHKTNNRAISVDPQGKQLRSLPEILKEYQYNNGLITTDRMTGATPSAFYAHVRDRDRVADIASELASSSIDLFIGGGRSDFLNENQDYLTSLKSRGVTILNSLTELQHTKASKVGFFEGENDVPSILQGRGDYLSQATTGALQFLSREGQPFFLMIEGAMIDTGGHWNSAATVVEEVIDFDKAVGIAIQFADQHPGTLVLITADHETGGVTIPQGNMESGQVELSFETEDHTAILVPLLAYGSHAEEFMGIYENTFVFQKLMELVKKAQK